MSLKERRIGVMMGGLSSEKDISLKSGNAVLSALRERGLSVVPLEVSDETEKGIRDLVSRNSVDIVFIAMHGGFGEGGLLQRILDKAHIPFTGPKEEASRLAMDKLSSRKLFRNAGLAVPSWRIINKKLPRFMALFVLMGLRYPLVVKPSAQGSSIGISFIEDSSGLDKALSEAFKYNDDCLVEEFIFGREITVSVLDGTALPVVEILPKHRFFDYEAKYEKGLTDYIVPALLDEKSSRRAQSDAVIAYRVLGCRHLARVDMIIGEKTGTPFVLEVNTIPGMTQTSLFPKAAAAAGIAFGELCTRLLDLAWDNYGKE